MTPRQAGCWTAGLVWAAACLTATGQPATEPQEVTISGQVFDHVGAGVEGMSVVVYGAADDQPVGDALAEATTEEYGDFTLRLPPDAQGTFLVRLTKKGYADIERVIEVSPEKPLPFVDVLAVGARRLEGRVKRSSDEAPIEGAEVTVSDGYGVWKGRSEERGRFVVEGIPPERVTVKVEAEGYATVSQELSAGFEVEPLEIWLEPGWAAIVKIVDPLGTPIPEVVVEALTAGPQRLRTAVTNHEGEATFPGLGPALRRLQLRFTHFALPQADEFDRELLRDGQEMEVRERFAVELAGRVKGVVRDAKTAQPVYSARVMAGEYIGGSMPKAWTDHQGEYSLASLQPGGVVLTVHHAEYAPALQEVEVGSGQTRTVEFQLGSGRTVRGQVVDAEGQPLDGAQVLVTLWQGYETAGMIGLTDKQGRFVFEHAPLEPFEVAASKSGYLSQAHKVENQEPVRLELAARALGAGDAALAAKYGPGDAVPDLSFKTLQGKELSLAGLRGQVVLLIFWASWCGPCVEEIPELKKVCAQFGGRDDFVMIGVSLDRSEARLAEFIKEQKLDWPQVFGGKGWDSGPAGAFGVPAIPATFVIDQAGKVAGVNLRGRALPDMISTLLP